MHPALRRPLPPPSLEFICKFACRLRLYCATLVINNNGDTTIAKKSQIPKRAPLKEAKVLKAAQTKTAKVKDASKSQFGGFINFIREQGVVGLAVGLAIGTAAGTAVKQIVEGFINPIVGFLIGGIDLAKLKWVIVAPRANGTGGLALSWGAILSALITLAATAFVIYWLVHVAKLDRLDRKKDA